MAIMHYALCIVFRIVAEVMLEVDAGGQEVSGVAFVLDDFADEGAADAGVFGQREQEHGVNFWFQEPVGGGDGTLVLEVGGGTEAAQYVEGVVFDAEISREVAVCLNLYPTLAPHHVLDEFEAAFHGHEAFFLHVDADGYYYLVKNLQPPIYQGLVTRREGVEGAGEYCSA